MLGLNLSLPSKDVKHFKKSIKSMEGPLILSDYDVNNKCFHTTSDTCCMHSISIMGRVNFSLSKISWNEVWAPKLDSRIQVDIMILCMANKDFCHMGTLKGRSYNSSYGDNIFDQNISFPIASKTFQELYLILTTPIKYSNQKQISVAKVSLADLLHTGTENSTVRLATTCGKTLGTIEVNMRYKCAG